MIGASQTTPPDPEAMFYLGLIEMNAEHYIEAANFFRGASSEPELLERSKPFLVQIKEKIIGG